MRIYINSQFYDGPHRTRLLSLGMVSQLGEWYRIVNDQGAVEHARKDPWIRQHVLGRLPWDEEGRDWVWDASHGDFRYLVERESVADDLMDFVDAHTEPELWGWQSAYAYTCIRHLFGRLTERPAGFPAYCGELMAEWHAAGEPELPPRGVRGHHALEMARWAQGVARMVLPPELPGTEKAPVLRRGPFHVVTLRLSASAVHSRQEPRTPRRLARSGREHRTACRFRGSGRGTGIRTPPWSVRGVPWPLPRLPGARPAHVRERKYCLLRARTRMREACARRGTRRTRRASAGTTRAQGARCPMRTS